ncbi:MAG: hypothetical protein EXS15_05985 [Phycisphaerales bacterium]|nr:hypothetical protein [Phycisphaerales bacterium]
MSSFSSNRDEIIELAQLEALGVLEGVDCSRLERLFRDTTLQVQREVLDLQAAVVTQTLLLPTIEPEGSLRLRVLATVAQAVEASDAELAPIATIGRPTAGAEVSSMSSDSESSLSSARTSKPLAVDLRWRRSSMMWRAACVTAIGGLVVSLLFQISTSRQSVRISELALQNETSVELSSMIGLGFREFLNQQCVVKGLSGATIRDNGSATVILTPTFDAVMVVWIELARDQTLTLRSVDRQSGIATTVGDFKVGSPVGGARLAVPTGGANANSDWQVVDSRGSMLFSTRPQ